MKALRSIVTAFQMFSRLPTPRVKWEDDNMRYMLPAFPLVVLCGARGLLLPLAAGLAAARLYQICTKQFGGMSGDLSGYFLSLAELFMLAAINLGGI